MNKILKQFKEGLLDNNPVLVQLLGMCPVLATTISVSNGIGTGLAATAVLICSNLFISLLRKFIPKQVRIAAYIVIISGFVTAVELLMRAYFYDLYQSLGLFIQLIVVNCIILARAEAFASKNKPLPSIIDGAAMGIGFTFALVLLAFVRELLGSGKIFGWAIPGYSENPMVIFVLPAGAFISLGLVIAVVQKIRNTGADRTRLKEIEETRKTYAKTEETAEEEVEAQ